MVKHFISIQFLEKISSTTNKATLPVVYAVTMNVSEWLIWKTMYLT